MTNATEDLLWVSQVVLFKNRRAFEKLVNKYQSPLRRFLLNLTDGDKAMSDDLSQETFIKAYLRLSTFKGASKFSTWLFRIGYNEFYDSVRSKKIQISLNDHQDLHLVNELSTSDDVSIDAHMDLREALGVLRSEERTAILLVYMEGFTHHQAAEIMNCPLGTVKSYILRGKNKIQEFLKEEAYGAK
jgi:RNA polymerase sigma-70 factor (ECF subfamily)